MFFYCGGAIKCFVFLVLLTNLWRKRVLKCSIIYSIEIWIRWSEELILVFICVLVFLWSYQRIFPHPDRLKMILAIVAFSVLVLFLVSFVTVYGAYWISPVFGCLSIPFLLQLKHYIIYPMQQMWFRGEVFFLGIKLLEIEHFSFVDISASALLQLILIFTLFNTISAPLALISYMLKDKLISRIAGFQEHARNKSLYR